MWIIDKRNESLLIKCLILCSHNSTVFSWMINVFDVLVWYPFVLPHQQTQSCHCFVMNNANVATPC